jgi:hypothetical protein
VKGRISLPLYLAVPTRTAVGNSSQPGPIQIAGEPQWLSLTRGDTSLIIAFTSARLAKDALAKMRPPEPIQVLQFHREDALKILSTLPIWQQLLIDYGPDRWVATAADLKAAIEQLPPANEADRASLN